MKNCPNCGSTCDDNVRYCLSCGSKIENTTNNSQQENTTNNSQKENTTKKKKSPKKIIPILIPAIILGTIIPIVLIALIFGGGDDGLDKSNPIGKTVMVYVVGSDLESVNGAASVDLSEISESGVDTDANNVLVYTGGSLLWQNEYVTAEENAILKLTGDTFEKLESYPIKSMGESSTLSEFITYGMTNYPNEQYVLLLWNHGGGPIQGYGFDELNDYDILSMEEIQTALTQAGLNEEKQLELIGFDACLMGNIETAWCLKDYAKYMVASQETEPGFGWDYEFLENLQYYQNGQELGKYIIDSYISSHKLYEMTLSCFDLSKVDKVEKSINDLFADVGTEITPETFAKLSKIRYETKSFAKAGGDSEYDIVDLNHLVTLLEEHYPEKAKIVKENISELVCYSQTNVTNASGVSICHPYENDDYVENIDIYIQLYKKFGFAENYTRYLLNFGLMLNGYDADEIVKYSNIILNSGTNNTFKVELTTEQLKSLAGAKYTVYVKIPGEESNTGKDEFFPIYTGEDITVDENGALYATYNSKAVFIVDKKTGEDSGIPMCLDYLYDGSGDFRYSTDAFFSRITGSEYEFGYDAVDVKWMLKSEGDEVYFSEAIRVPTDEEAANFVSGKQTVNPEDYDTYNIVNPSYFAVADENGNITLEKTGGGYGFVIDKSSGYELQYKEIDNFNNYYMTFEFVDIYGVTTMTNLTPFVEGNDVVMDSTDSTQTVVDKTKDMAAYNLNDGKIAFEGTVRSFPMKVSDFVKAGWKVTTDLTKLGANEGNFIYFTKGQDMIGAGIINTTSKEIPLNDAVVYDMDYNTLENSNTLIFAKGIKLGMSKTDFLNATKGYKFETTNNGGEIRYETPYTGDGYRYKFIINENGCVSSIRLIYEY